MKKRFLSILTAALVLMLIILPGCYFIQSQKMKNVKGTYKLSHYSVTDGETSQTTDYVAEYGYEEYLIVTGTSQGYFVHKDNNQAAYCVPITLTYEYDEEDSSKVTYVKYTLGNSSSGEQKFGVTKDSLNYSIPSINIGFAHSDGVSKGYKKVSNETDLSYAKSQLGELRAYTAEGWNNKGIWMLIATDYDSASGQYVDSPYVYYFVAINGYDNQITVYWADKLAESENSSNAVPEQKQKTLTLPDGFSWSSLEIDELIWTQTSPGNPYSCTSCSWTLSLRYTTVNLTAMQAEIDELLSYYNTEAA